MKIMKKIASLTLLTVCLQGDAAASLFQTGADGFIATCNYNRGRFSALLKNRFKQTYGLDTDVCNPANIQAVQKIQAFIADGTKFNAATQTFVDDTAVQDFVNQFAENGNILSNSTIFPTNYLAIAQTWLEAKVKSEATQAAALQDIAKSLVPLTGGTVPPVLSQTRIKGLADRVVESEKEEKATRELLNNLTLKWNPTPKRVPGARVAPDPQFEPDPLPLVTSGGKAKFPKAVYNSNLTNYIETTFARRLQSLIPVEDPSFASILTLIQDPTTPLTTNLLNPVITPNPTDYLATENQALPVLKAMKKEITNTDAELKKITGVTGAIPAGPLSAKTAYIIAQMHGAVTSAKGAISAILSPVAGLVGYTIPAIVPPATTPAIDEVVLANNAASAINATEAQLDRISKINPTFTFTPAQTTLQTRATALLTHLSGQLTTALKEKSDTDAELTRVAGTLTPAFPLPAGTLPARATALLGHLSTSGSSAGIDAYLDTKLADNIYGELDSSLVSNTRTALNMGKGKKNARIEPINNIIAGLKANAAYAAATTAQDKVKAAITYLTGELYVSYMWLTKDKEGATGSLTAIPGVPPYANGPAQDVAAAAQGRITALINAIKILHAENATLKTGGHITINADTDATIITAATTTQGLQGQLTPCAGLVSTRATRVDLGKFDAAVSAMVAALTDLTTGMPAASATTGAALAKEIRDAIKASATATLSASLNTNVETVNSTLSGFITLPVLPGTKKLTALNDNAITISNMLQSLAHDGNVTDGTGTVIPAATTGTALILGGGGHVAPATLVKNIKDGLQALGKTMYVQDLLNPAATGFFNINDLRITGATHAAATGNAMVASLLCRNSLMFVRDVVTATGVKPATPATDWADFATLDAAVKTEITRLKAEAAKPAVSTGITQAQVDAAVKAVEDPLKKSLQDTQDELGKQPQDIADELMNPAGKGATMAFAALPGGFSFAGITRDAPAAGADLQAVGNYLRQCALAANLLKQEAGLTAMPATMQDLMAQAVPALKAKMTPAGAPATSLPADLQTIAQLRQQLATAQATAKAPATAAIPAAAIAGHNASVAYVVSQFNKSGKFRKQTGFPTIIPALNTAAAALGAGAQTITLNNPDGTVMDITDKSSRDAFVGVTDPTNPDATNSTWATAA